MDHLELFNSSEFGELKVLLIEGKKYFPATACAKILGYKRPADAITAHCKNTIKRRTLTNGGWQEQKFISEGELYCLMINSRLPSTEKFEKWIFEEVLPSITENSGRRRQQDMAGKEKLSELIADLPLRYFVLAGIIMSLCFDIGLVIGIVFGVH